MRQAHTAALIALACLRRRCRPRGGPSGQSVVWRDVQTVKRGHRCHSERRRFCCRGLNTLREGRQARRRP